MKLIENKTFDEERALYNECDLKLYGCSFDGPADGESALKESQNIQADKCFFNLRYPFWHNHDLIVDNSEFSEYSRAAIWYSDNIIINNTHMHGIKALRECSNANIRECEIISPEFGWYTHKITMSDTIAKSEYFMMQSSDLNFDKVTLNGKYSFQYTKNAFFNECNFDTKDAFWHSKNVTIKESIVKGEYLAWYSDGLTLINSIIIGTQPFCYCKNLRLINCEMHDTDLCFEKSDVMAEIKTNVISIKNPSRGAIIVPSVGEIIMEDENSKCKINVLYED